MWKFKSLTGRDKWLFLLTIGVILCILAFPVGNGALSVKKTSGSVTERELELSTCTTFSAEDFSTIITSTSPTPSTSFKISFTRSSRRRS